MSGSDQQVLVDTAWLEAHLAEADLAVVDASWHMPATGRNGRAEYEAAHIPRAIYFDIDEIADQASALPHTLPSADDFASAVGALGIAEDMRIVVYESAFPFSSPRGWLMFRLMGARQVMVLDGGFRKWQAEGRPVESGPVARPPALFRANFDRHRVQGLDEMRTIVAERTTQVIDARSPARFTGEEPDPRPGVRAGHIPGAHNMHYARFASAEGTFRSPDEIATLFGNAGVDIDAPITTSCGSGVTAAVPLLALALLGRDHGTLYDGSWSEWGSRDDTGVETGPGCGGLAK